MAGIKEVIRIRDEVLNMLNNSEYTPVLTDGVVFVTFKRVNNIIFCQAEEFRNNEKKGIGTYYGPDYLFGEQLIDIILDLGIDVFNPKLEILETVEILEVEV